jgi:hypothetical protein
MTWYITAVFAGQKTALLRSGVPRAEQSWSRPRAMTQRWLLRSRTQNRRPGGIGRLCLWSCPRDGCTCGRLWLDDGEQVRVRYGDEGGVLEGVARRGGWISLPPLRCAAVALAPRGGPVRDVPAVSRQRDGRLSWWSSHAGHACCRVLYLTMCTGESVAVPCGIIRSSSGKKRRMASLVSTISTIIGRSSERSTKRAVCRWRWRP